MVCNSQMWSIKAAAASILLSLGLWGEAVTTLLWLRDNVVMRNIIGSPVEGPHRKELLPLLNSQHQLASCVGEPPWNRSSSLGGAFRWPQTQAMSCLQPHDASWVRTTQSSHWLTEIVRHHKTLDLGVICFAAIANEYTVHTPVPGTRPSCNRWVNECCFVIFYFVFIYGCAESLLLLVGFLQLWWMEASLCCGAWTLESSVVAAHGV